LDDSRKWWKARNSRGVVAHVPHTIVTEVSLSSSSSSSNGHHPNNKNHYNNGKGRRDSVGDRVTSGGERPIGLVSPSNNENADWIRGRQGKKGEFRYF